MWTTLLMVGAGGLIGAVGRYLVGTWVQGLVGSSSFPLGTLLVNVVGCLLIGVLVGLAETRDALNAQVRLFLVVGLLGGFTTYSAFGYETVALLRSGDTLAGLANVGLQLALGLAAVWVGLRVSQWA